MSGTNIDQSTQVSAWQAFTKAYFNPQALALAFLGFAAGIPIMLVFSSLGLWLREAGIDIPFPQRVIHIGNATEVANAVSSNRGTMAEPVANASNLPLRGDA